MARRLLWRLLRRRRRLRGSPRRGRRSPYGRDRRPARSRPRSRPFRPAGPFASPRNDHPRRGPGTRARRGRARPQELAAAAPRFRPIALLKRRGNTNEPRMSDRAETYAKTVELIEPFNKKGVAITEATRFAQDL